MTDNGTTKKSAFAFGFSKTKVKTNLVQTSEAAKSFGDASSNLLKQGKADKIELITSVAGNKINALNDTNEKKGPLVIPCQKNSNLLDDYKLKKQKAKASDETSLPMETNGGSKEDLEAVRALMADSENRKKASKNENNLVIESASSESGKKVEASIEEPDYEKVEIEKFGLAALRGMGWSEKDGIGLTNKRKTTFIQPEVRPKGLGLGAGPKKPKGSEENNDQDTDSSANTLRYVKGAYLRIESGKHEGEYGQLVGFDDGLNRIMVKIGSTNETVSLIQYSTKLVSKDEFRRAQEKAKRSSGRR